MEFEFPGLPAFPEGPFIVRADTEEKAIAIFHKVWSSGRLTGKIKARKPR